LVHPDGTKVTFKTMKSRDIPAVYSIHTKAIYQWFVSFRTCFLKSYLVCHLTETWSL
jgi:hypothetical protein